MSFRCPECLALESLVIAGSIELPADARSDEITLQWVACAACGFRALAVYEESRRGSLDGECLDHTGYLVSPGVLERMIGLMEDCPNPSDDRCECPAHRCLGKTDGQGSWAGLAACWITGTFRMEMA